MQKHRFNMLGWEKSGISSNRSKKVYAYKDEKKVYIYKDEKKCMQLRKFLFTATSEILVSQYSHFKCQLINIHKSQIIQ